MSCINKNLPGYKELKAYFGDSLTNSLIRNNDMVIPTVEDASRMIKGNKVLQFKKALNYLRSTTSASTENLLASMPRILQKKGSDIYVLKGSRLSEQPSPGAKINVENANINFLKKVNEAFGPIFKIEKDYGLTKAQIAEINSFSKELLDEGVGVVNLYADMLQTDPVEFFKFVSQQAQNLDADDNVNKNLDSTQSTLDSFGETIVNFAKELFPAKVGTTGLSMITGKEPVIAGKPLPTRFQSGTTVGFVEESLKVARDSNNTIGSPYLTNAIYYAEGKVKGPASIPNNVVLPYSNKKLADQLNKLKEQFRAIPASSIKDKAKREALKTKIFSIADTVYDEFKAALKNNIRSIYEAWDSTLINRSKHWYDGANRIAQNFANTYGLSLEASSATIAVLSPQNEWFNNISAAYRVMDIMKFQADTKVTADMFEQALAQSRDEPFSIVIDALKNKYVGNSINDILSEIDENAQDVNSKALQDIVASMLRVVDLAVHNRDVSVVLPEGLVSGIKQSGGTNAKFAWGSSGEIYKAISIFKNQDIENISTRLGKGNKVRNFYNNIANPNSKNGEVTVDTHAAGAGLLNVVGSDDTASMGLFRNDSVGNSPFYIVLKESYQEVAKEKGLLPRELQSVTWEVIRLLINESSKTPENRDFINNIWKQVQQKKLTQNAAIKTIIGNFEFGRPEWVRSTDPGTNQPGLSETGPAVQQDQRNASDLRGQRPGESGQGATGVATGDVIVKQAIHSTPQVFNNLTEDGKGNYVFFHYSNSDLSKKGIDPSKFGANVNKTGREEQGRTVPVSMYYTNDDTKETGVGNFKHVVRILQNEVYPFNSDPLKLYDEAEKRFREQYPDKAFSPNEQIGWIGKVAAERGYKMLVAKWTNGKQETLRAESIQSLKPELVSRPPKSGFYGEGTVESLTNEKFITNKKRYKGKIPVVQTSTQSEPVSDTSYNKGITLKAMQKFVDLSKNKKFANVADFAKDIFPSDVYEKYKTLYELARTHKLIVDVEPGSMQRVGGGVYSALASWGMGSINIDPSTIFTYVTNWDEFADVLNHEIIHGLLSRGLRASDNSEYNIHKELTPIFKNIVDNFDKASDNVKETLSYIIDTSREYSGIRDFSEGSDNFDDRPSVENLEELITYAFTDAEFAKFLDTIPAITNNEESKTLTVWGQLKQILRNFINSITGKTALDDINSVLDKYFDVPAEEFSTLLEDNGQESTGTKVAEGTFRVTIDEQKLTDLVEENKKNPTEVPFEDNIPDEQYQKASYSEGYWRSEQEKRFAIENVVRMLNKKFNIPFEYENDAALPWAAKFSNGKIVLNLAKIGADSAFHEIAHPFVEMLKTENPELYNSLINELKSSEEGQKEIERVAKEYSELSPQEQLDEALVSLIGKNSSNQFLNSTETSPKKSLIQRFWDWVKDIFFNMGVDASTFSPTMSINDVASMISNPMFSIDLSRLVDLSNRDEYYQKKATQQMQRDFDALINDTIAKLKADVNIVGKTEEENKRKYFSSKQVEDLINDRKDINALNSFITSGLFNLKDVNDRFNEFITKYEAKGTKSKEDLRNLSLLLNEIEDNITLYGNAGPLLESIFEMFPDEKDNFSDWAYSLKREKRLMNEYQSWGVNVVADWLFPYHKKAVRQALASNNLYSVVSKEVYDNEVKLAAEEGITDKGAILDRAIKQEIRNTLLIAKRDASGITGYLAGVLNSRDSIASTVGQAVMDELHKALTYGQSVETKFKKLMKQYRGSSVFSSNAVEKEFYQKYLRKVKVWTYQGLGVDAKPKYEYKEHTAFHEEYEWDNFYNAKREFFDKLGPVPSKTDLAAYRKYKAARDGWFSQNTVITKDQNGKDARIPSPKYKNAQFGVLQNDPLFKEMYTTYKNSNNKLGKQGLRYGIVPQLSNAVVDVKGFKAKNALEGIRHWIGEQEQVYFVQSIAGGEKPVVPINHVRLLDEKDLSYNLINSVSKFATSSAKYESMSMLEPQVQILKNFIGGNNALSIKKRRTIKRSASGIKALSRIIHDDMYVESTKLNNQLNSFLNDAIYGQSMKKEVVQLWDSKFEVFKTNDKSLNGGPIVETLHGFENVREFTGLHDLDYSGFEFGKNRNVGEWTIKMTKKDWNFSVKKTADRLGLLTALQTMIVNPISATVNIIRGKSEVFVESLGGRYYNMKDYAFGEKEYWKAIGSGDFFEDLKGGKPSFLSSMLIDYDALQGELIDASGRTLERGLVNKLFRTRRLFFAQNGGEHYIQTQLMIAMMNHQKIKTTGGETLSLFEARKREFDGKLKMSDTNWTDDNNREFRETLNEVNTRLNGNYNKTDKAMIQRTWWGSAIMMFRKHIYNGLANRYRKGYVNYQTGNYTEGYWRQFAHGLVREIGEMARDRTIRKFNLNEQEKYAFKKFGGDIAMLMLFIAAFKMFDDDDDDNEFTDSATLIFRRLVSESGQYTPIIAPLEAGKIVKNPSAISNTVNNFYEAFKQTLADPTEEYERNGPGYNDGDNKAWKKWQRAIPGWRIVLNTSEPERMLQFYQQNSLGFLRPSAGKENEEETGNK